MTATAANPHTPITDPAAVTATLVDLRGQGVPVRLHRSAGGRGYEVVLTEISDEPPRLVWQWSEVGAGLSIAVGDVLRLEARRRAGHLMSSAMRCDLVSRDTEAGRFVLRTHLPMRLTLRHARQDWRARVVPGEMIVEARLTRCGAPALNGRLVDLSVGGCRVALAADTVPIPTGESVNLRLLFPNGEVSLFGARVSDMDGHGGTQRETGLIFAGLSDVQLRRLWFLTCEIDREAERRRRPRSELRRLAPSALFEHV